jgi:hypothetical protein
MLYVEYGFVYWLIWNFRTFDLTDSQCLNNHNPPVGDSYLSPTSFQSNRSLGSGYMHQIRLSFSASFTAKCGHLTITQRDE